MISMNAPRFSLQQYIDFLIASPLAYSAAEAGRVQPHSERAAAHDSITRLINRLEPDTLPLWQEVESCVKREEGVLVIDDSTLDKPYARHMGLVGRHWSGKHKRVVRGINLVTLLWTNGDALWPTDYRLLDPVQTTTKNDLFRDMLAVAKTRGFVPVCVLFDSWYSGLDNLKAVRSHGWTFLTQFKCNRLVDINKQGYKAVSEQQIATTGTLVHLKGFGTVKVFRVVAKDGHTEHWATNNLDMTDLERQSHSELSWGIEEYHRGLKQHTGVECCQMRSRKAQRNHIGCAIRAFVRLEWQRYSRGLNWAMLKLSLIREAIRAYLASPAFSLPQPATA